MPTPLPSSPSLPDLPVVGNTDRVPRADAVRNREAILCTARRLFAERGVDCTSMDAIAEAAGVGKGTLFRRFGDRSALVRAVLEETETDFQEGFIRGPAPLGPGAPPADRLVAFGAALLDHTDAHGALLLAAETGAPGIRFRHAVYVAYRTHVVMLLRASGRHLDVDYTADALLAALGAELVMHQRRGREVALDVLKDGWERYVRALLG
jgi:AcrR family transcriptional regulator